MRFPQATERCSPSAGAARDPALAWALARNDEGMAREEIERRLISAGVDPTPIAHLF